MNFEELRNAQQKDLQQQSINLKRQSEERQRINNSDFWKKLPEAHELFIIMWQSSVFPKALRDLQSLVESGILPGRALTISPINMVANMDNPLKYKGEYGHLYNLLTNDPEREREKLINKISVGARVRWGPYEKQEAKTESHMRIAIYQKEFRIVVSIDPDGSYIGYASNPKVHERWGEMQTSDLLCEKVSEKAEHILLPNWQNIPKETVENHLYTAFKHPYVCMSESREISGDFHESPGDGPGMGSL